MKTGEMRHRKSAPIQLNESPKYMHCPRRESILDPTPRHRSASSTWRNCQSRREGKKRREDRKGEKEGREKEVKVAVNERNEKLIKVGRRAD